MSRTRVKICGITRPEDAALAAELGTDFIGLNFYRGPRKITEPTAINVLCGDGSTRFRDLPATVQVIALVDSKELFGNRDSDLHEPVFRVAGFQIYANYQELPGDDLFPQNKERWIVQPIASLNSIVQISATLSLLKFHPTALLLDTASPDKLGGTGQSFNWHWIAEARAAGELNGLPPIILAGGLNPDNVAEAIRIAQPYAVDVSSGVEVPGKPGIKDPIKMRDFIQAAQNA